jgi:hypothetical protein
MPRLTLFLILTLPASLQAEDRYRVQFEPQLDTVSVEACFDGPPPSSLYRHDDAWRFTEFVRVRGGNSLQSPRSRRLNLAGLPNDACIEWKVDLADAGAENNYRLAMHLEQAFLSDTDLWFWRDDENREILVNVDLPTGMSLSTPWQEQPGQAGKIYRPQPTPASWSSRTAVGRFPIQQLNVPGTQLRLATIGKVNPGQQRIFSEWVRETADCVASIYGRFPQPRPQILVVAIGRQNEAVPWAHVIRGGGVAAEFFVDETRTSEELRADWTATHELSHMLLPLVSSRDRWLSEGLASYYQNVLRGRDGRLDEAVAWQKLHAGFERGKRATSNESLISATRSGRGATMRVYWSGAAIFLKADTRLRFLSGGTQSLDTALSSLQLCCLDTRRSWRARELFTELDRLTGYTVFSDLYAEHVPDNEFPDMEETYAQLGLVPRSGSMELDPDAPLGQIRLDIMQGAHQ